MGTMIGIIGAMASEVEILKKKMKDAKIKTIAGVDFVYGTIMEKNVVVAQCGIGKVCAALCTQAMIDHFDVACIINTGVAGGLYRELSVGDIVIASQTIEHDFDATAFGYVKGYVCTGGDGSQPTVIQTDPMLVSKFKIAADRILKDSRYFEGTIVSGDVFVSDAQLKHYLIQEFDAYAAEMEGASIARVAALNEVPAVVVRSISDLADQEANVSFEEFEKKAAKISSEIVLAMLEQE